MSELTMERLAELLRLAEAATGDIDIEGSAFDIAFVEAACNAVPALVRELTAAREQGARAWARLAEAEAENAALRQRLDALVNLLDHGTIRTEHELRAGRNPRRVELANGPSDDERGLRADFRFVRDAEVYIELFRLLGEARAALAAARQEPARGSAAALNEETTDGN